MEPRTSNDEPGTAREARWVDPHGVRWVAEAPRLAFLGRVASALADPALRPVREIPSRAHFRLPAAEAAGPGAFVKHYRLLGWPRRIRHLFRPLPAAIEYRVARALAPHGHAAVIPWAWGVRRRYGIPVECYLVTDDLGDLETLEEWVPRHRHLPHRVFRGALAELARTLRRMHDRRYFHGDPHQRNIVACRESGRIRWAFLDFQQAKQARLTAPYRRLRDLGRVFHGVRLELGRVQRAHLLRAYLGPGTQLPRRLFRLLEATMLYYEFRLLRRRARRCLVGGEHVRRSVVGGIALWHVPDADVNQIVVEIGKGDGGGEPSLVIRALPGRGRRAWVGAHALLARGLSTPRPLAWAVDHRRGVECLVSERPRGAMPLEGTLARAHDTGEEADLLRATGVALRRLHGLGGWGCTGDGCLLAVPAGPGRNGWTVLLARPERCRFRPWVGRRQRRRDIAGLAAAIGKAAPDLSEEAWRAFLQGYLRPSFGVQSAELLWDLIRRRGHPAPFPEKPTR